MRVTTRRQRQRDKAPRISISQEEITADLVYPARRTVHTAATTTGRGRRR